MPSTCAIADCKSSKKLNPLLIHHRFPVGTTNAGLISIWIARCKRADKGLNPSSARVCSEHFTENDYQKDLQSELLGTVPRKKLKAGAIPNVFPGRLVKAKTIIRKSRHSEIRERKKFVQSILAEDNKLTLPQVRTPKLTLPQEQTPKEDSKVCSSTMTDITAAEIDSIENTIITLRRRLCLRELKSRN